MLLEILGAFTLFIKFKTIHEAALQSASKCKWSVQMLSLQHAAFAARHFQSDDRLQVLMGSSLSPASLLVQKAVATLCL